MRPAWVRDSGQVWDANFSWRSFHPYRFNLIVLFTAQKQGSVLGTEENVSKCVL